MSKDKPKKKPAEFGIVMEGCSTKEQLFDLVNRLADEGKAMAIVTANKGWDVSYNTGPVQK